MVIFEIDEAISKSGKSKIQIQNFQIRYPIWNQYFLRKYNPINFQTDFHMELIRDAMNNYQENTCVHFQKRKEEERAFVKFINDTG